MSHELNCYDNFLTYFMEFILHRGYCTKSVEWESCVKSSIREFCPPNYFISRLVYQTEGFDNLRTRKFEVNKERGKSKTEGKDGNCYKKISHISYKLPLMFFIFSLILLYKLSNKRCQLKRLTWHTLTPHLYLDYFMIIFTIQSFWNSLRWILESFILSRKICPLPPQK